MLGLSPFQATLPVEDRYVPALPEQVLGMFLRTANHGDRHIDLGCGKGGVLEVARALGLDSHGVELDPELAAMARAIHPNRVQAGDWSDYALSSFDIATVYCSKASGEALLAKARREMRRGSRFITFWGYPSFVVI